MNHTKIYQQVVLNTLCASKLTQDDITSHENDMLLAWQIPAIEPNLHIDGVDLSFYLNNFKLKFSEAELLTWLTVMLARIPESPGECYQHGVWKSLHIALPKAGGRQKLSALIVPPESDYPILDDPYAAIKLNMDACNVVLRSRPIEVHVSDESNYFCKTEEGHTFGVFNNRPLIGAEKWPASAEGMVQQFLAMPRGGVIYEGSKDTLTWVRSLANRYHDKIPNFAALDQLLQWMKFVNAPYDQLANLGFSFRHAKVEHEAKLYQVKLARDIFNMPELPDREKLVRMKAILVPDVMSSARFAHHFGQNSDRFAFKESRLDRMQVAINRLLIIYGGLDA